MERLSLKSLKTKRRKNHKEEEEKKKEEEALKKLKENKYKAMWDVEFANSKLIESRAQDNSIFRVLKSWQEKEGWKQT